jgi:peptide methionine sulfoxide reductase MsrA
VCAGGSGHAEVVRVTYDPAALPYEALLQLYFSAHDPTTPDRQGSDAGPQYRPLIACHSAEQAAAARRLLWRLQAELAAGGEAPPGPETQGAEMRAPLGGRLGIAAAATVLASGEGCEEAGEGAEKGAGATSAAGELLAPLLEALARWEQGVVVTQVLAPGAWSFWPAEAYHASFYELNLGQGYCSRIIRPRLERFREAWAAAGLLQERRE